MLSFVSPQKKKNRYGITYIAFILRKVKYFLYIP